MPEMPDLTIYAEHLQRRLHGAKLSAVRLASPFLLRSVSPAIDELTGRSVVAVRRFAKQVAIELTDEFFMVVHLMIAGRLRWCASGQAVPKRIGLAAFDFDSGTLILTEASKKRRAALRLVAGRQALQRLHPGGLEVFDIGFPAFFATLKDTPHTVKRALTDQRVFCGIGNAYSDEILFRARMSPFKQGRHMTEEQAQMLFAACRDVLTEWTDRLRDKAGTDFPGQGGHGSKVTAFHPEMAVHGKYKEPCSACGAPVQRIVHAENETNYCAQCQTAGRLLADRSLSRLLKGAYPKHLEDWED